MFKFPYEKLTWERGIEFTVDRLKKNNNNWYTQILRRNENEVPNAGKGVGFNSLLTRRFLQKVMPVAGGFYFGWPKTNSVISLILCVLLHSIVTPDTSVKSSDFCEMLFSIHFSPEGKQHSPALWVSFSLSVSESITSNFFCWSNIHIVWIRTVFWRTVIFWDTSIYVTWRISKYLHKIRWKIIFHLKFCDASFLKILHL